MRHYIDLQYYMLVLSFKVLLFRSLSYTYLKFYCFGHLVTFIYSNLFHNLSKSMEFVNLIKHFKYLFLSSLFSFGQLSCFFMFLFRTSLSLCSFGQSYIRWSTVWLPVPQGHSDDSIILNLWTEWDVIMNVHRYPCTVQYRYSYQILIKFACFRRIFQKYSNIKFNYNSLNITLPTNALIVCHLF